MRQVVVGVATLTSALRLSGTSASGCSPAWGPGPEPPPPPPAPAPAPPPTATWASIWKQSSTASLVLNESPFLPPSLPSALLRCQPACLPATSFIFIRKEEQLIVAASACCLLGGGDWLPPRRAPTSVPRQCRRRAAPRHFVAQRRDLTCA